MNDACIPRLVSEYFSTATRNVGQSRKILKWLVPCCRWWSSLLICRHAYCHFLHVLKCRLLEMGEVSDRRRRPAPGYQAEGLTKPSQLFHEKLLILYPFFNQAKQSMKSACYAFFFHFMAFRFQSLPDIWHILYFNNQALSTKLSSVLSCTWSCETTLSKY